MAIERVLFLGSKPLGVRTLALLARLIPQQLIGALTIDDRADARSAWDQLHALCHDHEIPLHVARDRAHAETLIRELRPELCIVSGWYWLLRQAVLDSVAHGFIGTHFSLLPKYRGGSPLVWALINGEPEVGVSIFSFVEGVDAGQIWAQERVTVGPADYISDVLPRLEHQTIAALEKHLPGILSGALVPAEQDHAAATYCAMRFPADGEIYWRSPAAAVYNFVRAQSHPYPGAFTWFQGEQLTVWRLRLDPAIHYGTPGQVALVAPDGVRVVCGDHRAVILETVGWKGAEEPANRVLKSVSIRLPSSRPA